MFTSRSYGASDVTSRPPSSTEPESGRSKPAIMRSTVVLPEPDGPSSEKNSPSSITRSMSATATTGPNVLRTCCSSTARGFTSSPASEIVHRIGHIRRLPPASATGPAGSLGDTIHLARTADPSDWLVRRGPCVAPRGAGRVYRASDERCLPPRTGTRRSPRRDVGDRSRRSGAGRADRVDDGTADRARRSPRVHVVARRGSATFRSSCAPPASAGRPRRSPSRNSPSSASARSCASAPRARSNRSSNPAT